MAEINLSQDEADALLAMPKVRENEREWIYPSLGGRVSVPLVSKDKRESFMLGVQRGRIDLKKGSYLTLGRQVIILARLDFGGRPHKNPDGVEMSCPHLHVYREGFSSKWAISVPNNHFHDLSDPWVTLHNFMRYCGVVEPPFFKKDLFT